MASRGPFSKREASRAGAHLASRLVALRQGNRQSLVDADDPDDVRARDAVEWWRAQHIEPMLVVQEETRMLAPPLVPEDTEAAVSFRPKRFESMVDKLTREPGKLADMADVGGVRAVVASQGRWMSSTARCPPSSTSAAYVTGHDGRRPTGIELCISTFGSAGS